MNGAGAGNGGNGDDTIAITNAGSDGSGNVIEGDGGNDHLSGASSADLLNGGADADVLSGNPSFVELRKRQIKHRTLERIERQTRAFAEKRAREEQEADRDAQKALAEARERAYDAVSLISFDGMQYRHDIAAAAAEGQSG